MALRRQGLQPLRQGGKKPFSNSSIRLVEVQGESTTNHDPLCDSKHIQTEKSIFFIYFLLKDNCFTEFCCFLSNLNMNQP